MASLINSILFDWNEREIIKNTDAKDMNKLQKNIELKRIFNDLEKLIKE